MKYLTKNKKEILEILISHSDEHLTVYDIRNLSNQELSLASLYRIIDSFVEEGLVRKYTIDINTPSCYQYIGKGHEHFHLVCKNCGKIYHLECDEVNKLIAHIQEEHHFDIDISQINLYGLCKSCQKENI